MRIATSRDLGLYVRDRRRDLGLSQAELAADAGVSRHWVSDLEAGKASAEFGLILKTLAALELVLDAHPEQPAPDEVDLDALLRDLGSGRD